MVELGEHQRQAVNKLSNGKILVGGVGTGKSRTALAYYFTKVCGGRFKDDCIEIKRSIPLYIITTARKRDTYEWEEELENFICVMDSLVDVKVDSWNNISKYISVRNAFFIFDEQRLVGNGKWVKSFYKIASNNKWILLSATPGDDWSDYIPVFIANGFYRNRTEFLNRHAVYSKYCKYPKIDKWLETKRLNRLRDEILVIMNFKRKTHTNTNYISVDYNKQLYRTVYKDRWNIYDNKPIKNVSELCYTMRKVVNSDISRLTKLGELVKEHKKVIIFYNFDYELEKLRAFAETINVTCAEWNGHRHENLPTTTSWMYLVQYAAGAEGWNCIETDTIIFYSLNYSYKATVQAAGRINRMNTPFTELYLYYLYSSSSIDLGIRRCLQNKKNFNERSFINAPKGSQ